ncbi:TPA: DUF2971 domain-containing protein [Klebsiella aerogenes]|nr:DUF2971 domain-containing protein [Klebsiella aerogenes]
MNTTEKNGILFKYRNCKDDGLRVLRNRELWFATADNFNDPFEAETSFPNVLAAVWARKELPLDLKLKFEEALKESISTYGVCALSRARKNQLMWSHYADEHRGFCIGFKEKELRSQGSKIHAIDITYQSNYPYQGIIDRLNFFENHPNENSLHDIAGDIIHSILGTKYSGWRYERERRLIKLDSGALKFEPKAINSIAFGLRTSEESKKEIRSLLSGKEWSHVKWYKADKSIVKYSLDFSPMS